MKDDYISRADAIALLEKWADGYSYIETPTEDAIYEFNAIPTADVRPVVLCRDCKHYNPSNRDWKCEFCMGLIDPDEEDFCSFGERRENT